MPLKRCLDCFRWALPGKPRCHLHTRAKDQARGTTTARGYGWAHQQQRAADHASALPSDPCPRCGQPLGPPPWDQGHTPDRQDYEGPTHPACNRATAKKGR
jgi:hypothetical protein